MGVRNYLIFTPIGTTALLTGAIRDADAAQNRYHA